MTDSKHAGWRHPHFPHLHFSHHELHDRPLAGQPHPDRPLHWKLYGCEAVATALLMIIGIVCVVCLTAPGFWLGDHLAHYPHWQMALCGFCFGSAGTLAAMTPFGKVSGAHLNPSVTLAFTLGGRMVWLDALGYFVAQIVGAIGGTWLVYLAGCLFPVWRRIAAGGSYAATIPNPHLSLLDPLACEVFVTGALVLLLYWLAAHHRFQRLAAWAGGIYFLLMNPILAWISGNSVNFARSLGPALFAHQGASIWIYLVGPFIGAALAVLLVKSDVLGKIHLAEARIINFGHHGRVPKLEEPEATTPHPDELKQ